MFNTILVPLDGSALAERALKPALMFGREVRLLHVLAAERLPVPDGHSSESSPQEAADYLRTVQVAHPENRIQVEVAKGDPANVILKTAARENVDMIMMSTHGYSGFTRWMLGSVTEKVLRSATCPVLVVRSAEPMRNVLIPLDGSPLSESVLALGLGVGTLLNGEVTLLRATQVDETQWAHLEKFENGLGERAQIETMHTIETYLRHLALTHPQAGLKPHLIAKAGPAAQSIIDYADTHGIDLIVMSTHGRAGLKQWVYGSVTEKVLRGTHCSMLIARPVGYELN